MAVYRLAAVAAAILLAGYPLALWRVLTHYRPPKPGRPSRGAHRRGRSALAVPPAADARLFSYQDADGETGLPAERDTSEPPSL